MSEEAWRIDSLDARAGLAFGSWRHSDLIFGHPELDRPAVVIAPPYFRPEALSNRAIGFGASRGQAQLGVIVDEQELAFETLDALSEFVRRVYQAGGGGDLPGGGATGGRPRPPGGEPRGGGPDMGGTVLDRPMEGGGGSRSIIDAAKHADSITSELEFYPGKPIKSKPTEFPKWGEPSAPIDGPDESLVMGAQELLIELVRRFPIGSDEAADILSWSEAGMRLGDAISRLGLWYKVLGGPAWELFDRAAMQINSKLPLIVADRRGLIPLLGQADCPWHDPFLIARHSFRRSRDNDPVDDLMTPLIFR